MAKSAPKTPIAGARDSAPFSLETPPARNRSGEPRRRLRSSGGLMARPISRLLDTLASTLTALREALAPATPSAKTPKDTKASRRAAKTPKTAMRLVAAPKTAAAASVRRKTKTPNPRLALQGKYMAAIRGLSVANKAKVKKVLAAQGVEAAIALAQSKKG